MSFDCICIDFQNSKKNLDTIKTRMPHAKIIPFVKSYFEILSYFSLMKSNKNHGFILSSAPTVAIFQSNKIATM